MSIKGHMFSRYTFFLMFSALFMAMFLFYYGCVKHYNYMTSMNDIGHVDQSLWGTLNGKIFLNTIALNIEMVGRIEPIIFIFLPLYYMYSSVIWLIMAQSIFIPLTSIPIYLLAKKICNSEEAAIFWALSFLFSPFVINASSWDFHTVFITVYFVAGAYFALEMKKPNTLFLCCLLILMSKEHFGLLVFGFGLLWFFKYKELKVSATLASLGLFYFFIMMNLIIPSLSPTGQHLMLSEGQGHISRYGWLGGDLKEVVSTIVTRPIFVFETVFVEGRAWVYVLLLLIPVLFLPVLGVEFLIPGMSDILVNMLSANKMPMSIKSYYSITLIPVIIISAIYGSYRLNLLCRRAKIELQAFAVFVISAAMSFYFFPFYKVTNFYNLWNPIKLIYSDDENYSVVKHAVSPWMSVSAQANVGAHFTQREKIFMYPNKSGDADAIVLHLYSPTSLLSGRDRSNIGTLAHHLQMDPEAYLESIKKLLNGGAYGRILWKDPWLIMFKEKGFSEDKNKILVKIDSLKREWEIKVD